MIQFDASDPQADQVYRAQSDVVKAHVRDNLRNLAEVRLYVDQITSLERVQLNGVYRIWLHTGPSGSLVHRTQRDSDLTGVRTKDPIDGMTPVKILPWTQRYSHYAADYNEIVVAAPVGWPLSHRLLLIHEIAHAIKHDGEKHGPAWCQQFLRLTAKHLPHMASELQNAFDAWNVHYTI